MRSLGRLQRRYFQLGKRTCRVGGDRLDRSGTRRAGHGRAGAPTRLGSQCRDPGQSAARAGRAGVVVQSRGSTITGAERPTD